MRFFSNKRSALRYSVAIALIALVAISALSVYYSLGTQQKTGLQDGAVLRTGHLTVMVDNKTVYSANDAISQTFYYYILCYVWNAGCSANLGPTYQFGGQTITTTATLTSPVLVAFPLFMELGTGITSGLCNNIAGTDFQTLNGQTNPALIPSNGIGWSGTPLQVTLQTTWLTNTAVTGIAAVCMQFGYWTGDNPGGINNGLSGNGIPVGTTNIAYQTFSTQNLVADQSISVTWTFTL